MGWEGEESCFGGFIPLKLGVLETKVSGGLQG